MAEESLRLVIHIDGGARGNPGPAAAGVVIRTEDGTIVHEAGIFLGDTTNNVAEYRSLLAALETASALNAAEVEIRSDSELLVRQMTGVYRVRKSHLQELFALAQGLAGRFRKFSIQHVSRDQNKDADRLVNQAINLRRSVR